MMMKAERAPEVRGKTMRWTWIDGPTKGKIHEHVFREDGTVEFHEVSVTGTTTAVKPSDEPTEKGGEGTSPIEYGAVKVSDAVYLVSYLSGAGYTLTVALDFDHGSVVGFASGAKEWYPVTGTFEVVA
jgi:hypothetical protein